MKTLEIISKASDDIHEARMSARLYVRCDDGLVLVTSTEAAAADKAIAWIKDLTREIKAGEIFDGKVVRIMDFGAFVEVLPGKDGLVHVSEIAPFRVNQVTDLLQVGDQVKVKVLEIDNQGRVNLSIKETDHKFSDDLVAKAKASTDSSNDGKRFNGNDRGNKRFNRRR